MAKGGEVDGVSDTQNHKEDRHTEDTNFVTEAKLIPEMCRIPTISHCPSSQSIKITVKTAQSSKQ